jgi:photosystem II stability/assembly factor-like uncharacterized protein
MRCKLAAIGVGILLAACSGLSTDNTRVTLPDGSAWRKLDTVPYRGKQDDISFVSPDIGWYGNGGGKIYRTLDGGKTWAEQLSKPGTFVRAMGFIDARVGIAGNVGTDYYPGVTDTTPLYRTEDGGQTWRPITQIDGPTIKGVCAIDIVRSRKRTVVYAGGRVAGPAVLAKSTDGGKTWQSKDLSAHTKMILDVKFFDELHGLVFGATASNSAESNALIIATQDGGATWQQAYRSDRLFELTWKGSFPSRNIGYATVQSYNPDQSVSQRYVVKTVDGGATWQELPLVNDFAVREFGIAFANDAIGWVGTTTRGYQTVDGGAHWTPVELGRAVNKIRVLRNPASPAGFVAYAIGIDVYKFDGSIPNP